MLIARETLQMPRQLFMTLYALITYGVVLITLLYSIGVLGGFRPLL
jgi:hypothetical protein